jgi:hypothetical protein
VINTTLIGADRACSPERAFRTAVTNPVWAAAFTFEGHAMTGVLPAQYQGTTVSGVDLQGNGFGTPAFIAGDVTARVRKGVPAGTTTSSSPPV